LQAQSSTYLPENLARHHAPRAAFINSTTSSSVV
jgi:hypothetical protein